MNNVYRIQHARDGRGPFRPGFTASWSDDEGNKLRVSKPPWFVEFGPDAIKRGMPGDVFGSAVLQPEGLAGWFSLSEMKRLGLIGFWAVRVYGVRILAESANQVLFARATPLNKRVSRIVLVA